MSKLKILFLAILIALGLFLRIYDFKNRFYYGHDNDLASWIVKDIVVDSHTRLIGQLTSAPGIFIGSLFYYSLIPFYLIGEMDPLSSVVFSWIVGGIAILSMYIVTKKIHGQNAALISTFIYAISFSIVSTEREVVPTTAVFLWSTWFYFAIHRFFAGSRASLYLLAILFSLVWHIHLVLGGLVLLVALLLPKNIYLIKTKHFFLALLLGATLASPLFVFEARHNFSQTRSLFGSFGQSARVERSLPGRVWHVVEYSEKNINMIIWDRPKTVSPHVVPIGLLIGIGYLFITKRVKRSTLGIWAVWSVLFTLFFTFNPINLSEYYLNSLNSVWIIILGITLSEIVKTNKLLNIILFVILGMFAYHNISRTLNSDVNRSGYVEKTAVIAEIKADATRHGYPCVSISYITDAGNNLGYRYLIWKQGVKTAPVLSNAPVYSIVYPHRLVNRLDKAFGALGLIYPEYGKYTSEGIIQSCSGPDYNLTEPMFGFTK